MYVYEFENDSFKAYLPLETGEKKWVSNASKDILQGYEQLPKEGDHLIITKSLKDVMVLYELGFNAVAVQGETSYPDETVMEELKQRFSKIVVLFDNDGVFNPPKGVAGKGKQATKKFCTKFDLPYFFITGAKDVSDFIKEYGFESAKNEIEYGMGKPQIDFPD
jgi:DNA primase